MEGQFNYGNDPSMQRGAFGMQRKKNLGSDKLALMANILSILSIVNSLQLSSSFAVKCGF